MAARTEPTKFELRREATRAELIRLGIERFPIRGYSSTSIEDIVRDSALTRGAYYFHFSSKEDLFLACMEERIRRRDGWWEVGRSPGTPDLRAALEAIFGRFAEVDAGGLEWSMLQVDFWQTARHDPTLVERFHGFYETWIDEIVSFLLVLRERGMIDIEGSLRPISEAIFALSQGMMIHHQMYGADNSRLVPSIARLLRP